MSPSRQQRRQLFEQLVGQTINARYEIASLMGFGGMGAVYEAVDRNMNRRIALKYIPSHDKVTAARFEREALTVSKLHHPNTVTVFDYGETDDGFLYLSMELLDGRTLTDLIEEESPLAPARVVHIVSQICRSLAEAHQNGVVHRDIKPDNVILIEVDGDPDVAKVLDFGIAKAVTGDDDVTLTGDGNIVGTPRYMSPEQVLGEEIDLRSDIYSLGCIVFEMLCGAPPFDAPSTTKLMISHAQDPPPPFAERLPEHALDSIPLGLEHVVRRAMSKSPSGRPQNTDAFRNDLEEALKAHQQGRPNPISGDPSQSQPVAQASSGAAAPQPTAQSSGPNRFLIAGLAIAAVIVTALVMALIFVDGDDETITEDEALQAAQDQAPPDARPPSEAPESDEPEQAQAPPEISVSNTIHVRIESEPEGAGVFEEDTQIGSTPVNLSLSPGTGPLEYLLTEDGYQDKEISLTIDPDAGDEQKFAFELERERRPTRVRRPAPSPPSQPAPAPDDDADDGPTIELLGDDDDDDEDSGPRVPTL